MGSRFTKGVSGNPNGRPKGAIGKTTKLRLQLQKSVPAILDKLVEAALNGDIAAAKLILERALPALRPVDVDEAGNDVHVKGVCNAADEFVIVRSYGMAPDNEITIANPRTFE